MPITIITKQTRSLKSRGLLIGSPNKGKTNLLNKIHDETVIVLSYPGEKGTQSIPEVENVFPIILKADTLPDNASTDDKYHSSMEKYQAVLSVTRQIIKKEYGEFDIFFADGISKLYDIIMDVVSKGRFLNGDTFETKGVYTTRLYGPAHIKMRDYFSEIYDSDFPIVIATCWEKLREPDENASDDERRIHLQSGKRVWLPALPGQMGDLSTGEFDWCIRAGSTLPSICTHCRLLERNKRSSEVSQGLHPTFQLKAYDDVQCVGVKGKELNSNYTFIHQDWSLLKRCIL